MRFLALLLIVLALASCSRRERAGEPRAGTSGEQLAKGAFDWRHPESSLRMDADAAAARIGSFDWECSVSWSARSRNGPPLHASERHHLRQRAEGDFFVENDIDPGEGPGSDTGLRVVWTRGMTYARSRYAASGAWRERPTDRGRDARRFRDQSFLAVADVAALLGPALTFTERGEATRLERPGRSYSLSLDRQAFASGPTHLAESPPSGGVDEDTRKRLAFLDGREPLSTEGELIADAATGVPLEVRLRAAFGVRDDPEARVEVELFARMTALGAAAGSVSPPATVLPDERKPKGVARALEAAGRRKKKAPAGEPEVETQADSE